MIRSASPVRTRDHLDELVDDDAAAMVPGAVEPPGPVATLAALASLVLVGALAAITLFGWLA